MRPEKLITPETLADNIKSPWWRLNNLYKIINLEMEVVTFKPNEAQTMLLQNNIENYLQSQVKHAIPNILEPDEILN